MNRLLIGLSLLLAATSMAQAQTTGNATSGYRSSGTIFSVDSMARTIVIGATQYAIARNVSIFFLKSAGNGIRSLARGMHVAFVFERNSNTGSPMIYEMWVLPADSEETPLPPPPS